MIADLAMVIHFHQPVGNFDDVIGRACDKCYSPFLELLKKYPGIKMNLHFSGCLMEWVEVNRPEIIDMIKEMVEKGQIEVLSGGFYEPILPSIPAHDRVRQIDLLSEYVKDKFKYEPKGAWVAERVWEPVLPSVLYDAGIKYIVLDDTHFLYSGIDKDQIYGYYITEDNGKTVAVFPSDKVLRYYIPYKMPEECMEYMRGVAERNERPTFVYGDDGEKFGEWPGTYKWVYEEKWLEKFFDEIVKNSEWLKTTKLSECFASKKPMGRVYLPTTSYEEMLEWALPADKQEQMEDVVNDIRHCGKEEYYKPFIRGGFWRNFLSKYPESDNMNKKMIHVSNKLRKIKEDKGSNDTKLEEAEKELFRGQCNCAYWHAVFGGLYLFHLRRAIYQHLIKSEAILDEVVHGSKQFSAAEVIDIDADGADEVILENREISLCFDPAEGGALKEFSSKKECHNFINSLARRKEAYHRKILKKLEEQKDQDTEEVRTIHDDIQVVDESIRGHLDYDWYNRYSFLDHFIGRDTDINDLSKCTYEECGNFVIEPYDFNVEEKNKEVILTMERKGQVKGADVKLTKKIKLPEAGSKFKVEYFIENMSDKTLEFRFGPEINVTMPDADADKYVFVFDLVKKEEGLDNKIDRKEVESICIKDREGGISFEITLSEKMGCWCFPVKTVSQSEKAYELNYQSSVIFPHKIFKLDPAKIKSFDLEVDIIK